MRPAEASFTAFCHTYLLIAAKLKMHIVVDLIVYRKQEPCPNIIKINASLRRKFLKNHHCLQENKNNRY